jgi:hypothetical protein
MDGVGVDFGGCVFFKHIPYSRHWFCRRRCRLPIRRGTYRSMRCGLTVQVRAGCRLFARDVPVAHVGLVQTDWVTGLVLS